MKIRVEGIRKVEKEGSRLLGVVDVILNEIFVIEDIKIILGPSGRFIAMPSKKINDTFIDLAFPINIETRDELTNAVLSAFDGKGSIYGEIDETVITNLNVKYTSNATGVVANIKFEINNRFLFTNIFMVKELTEDGSGRFKFLYPTREDGEGNRRNIYYSINREFTDKLFKTIFDKYKEGLN